MEITLQGLDSLPRAVGKTAEDTAKAIERATVRSLNRVADRTATLSRRDIAAQINLTQRYIRAQMEVKKASRQRQVAEIRARLRAVRMARFDARQVTERAPDARAAGDPLRKIAKGRKAAGVSVKIARGNARTSRRAGFLIPLRAGAVDGGNGMGLFVRTGRGRTAIEHKYGPSPDQLFRRWAARPQNEKLIADLLEETFSNQIRHELTGSRS
ncbi:phage tail protein [Thauera aromatica]|uniref:phage tail protein n=1 Tax=Thauera aromatica TaxID=59405 RepID=UPI001FFD2CA3|nr:phage tail protein [Thauera aromatica]MCK2095228.1 phage tail protein [Thauera aromatica]